MTLARSKTSVRSLYWGQLKKDYRAVSNLTFLSKVTEKVVDQQLSYHTSSFQLYSEFRQAYWKFHGTETALLHVWNEILMNMNEQQVTLLVFLDLSAAFDTMDQVWRASRLLFRPAFVFHSHEWIFSIIRHHLPSMHCYADDTQFYLAFKPVDTATQDTALSAMKARLRDIRQWMIKDKLMINDEKTEFMMIGTKGQLS